MLILRIHVHTYRHSWRQTVYESQFRYIDTVCYKPHWKTSRMANTPITEIEILQNLWPSINPRMQEWVLIYSIKIKITRLRAERCIVVHFIKTPLGSIRLLLKDTLRNSECRFIAIPASCDSPPRIFKLWLSVMECLHQISCWRYRRCGIAFASRPAISFGAWDQFFSTSASSSSQNLRNRNHNERPPRRGAICVCPCTTRKFAHEGPFQNM